MQEATNKRGRKEDEMSTSMSVRKWVVVIAAGLISAPAPVTEAAAGLGTLKHSHWHRMGD